ncbi:MAG: ANTAR domain-containing response regulator [Huintestinicola sp.]
MPDHKTLIAAASEEVRASVSAMASEAGLRNITITDGKNLKALCDSEKFGVIVMVLPLENEFGLDAAAYISKRLPEASLVVCAPSKVYEEVCARISSSGALIIPKSSGRATVVNTLRTAAVLKNRFDELRQENTMLKEMIDEVKLVNRAKCVLIEYLRISEKEAHRQIQKRAMDQRITLTEVAADILKTYEYL